MGGNPILHADPNGDDFKDKNGNNVKAADGIVATGDGLRITNTNENRNWDYGTWNEGTSSYDMHYYDRRKGLSAGDVLDGGDYGLASQMSALSAGNLSRKATARAVGEGSYIRNVVESDGWGGYKMTGIVAPVNDDIDRAIQDLDVFGISGGNGALIVAKAPLARVGALKVVQAIANTAVDASKVLSSASTPYKGSTLLGHALSKHAQRHPSIWGKLSGHASTWHNPAQKHFDDIMAAPGQFAPKLNKDNIQFLEKMLPDGRGMRLNMNGTFKGFID